MNKYFLQGCLSIICIACTILIVPGCRKELPAAGSAAPPMVNTGAAITEADIKTYAKKLEVAVEKRDGSALEHLLRLWDIAENSIKSLNPPSELMQGIKQETSKGSFSNQVTQTTSGGGSLKMIRIRTENDRPIPIFRMIAKGGGINYLEIPLVRYPDGDVGAEDIIVASKGEPISQTLRRVLIPVIGATQKNLFNTISQSDKEFVDNLDKIKQLTNAINGVGDAGQAMSTYRAFPESVRNNRAVAILALQLAQKIGERDYVEELERFKKSFPNDRVTDILSIDYYIAKKQFDKVIDVINNLNKSLGGDPYLDVLRGNIYVELKQYDKAKEAYQIAMKGEPDLYEAYAQSLGLALLKKDFDETLSLCKVAIEKCNSPLNVSALNRDPLYAEFIKTKQYEELKSWYATQK